MAQYCRYCAEAVLTENEDIYYCTYKRKTMNVANAKRTNNCKNFTFNEIDLLDFDKRYKPRVAKKSNDNQISLFDEIEKG